MIVSLITSLDKNRGIGKDNQLLVKIPSDLKRFKKLTTGHTVIMGKNTFQSIGRALPKRSNIVLSRSGFAAEGCLVKESLPAALEYAKEQGETECFIIGGGQVFAQSLPLADKLYLTLIDAAYPADTYFPDYSDFSKVLLEEKHEENGIKFKYVDLLRSSSLTK